MKLPFMVIPVSKRASLLGPAATEIAPYISGPVLDNFHQLDKN